ncbi:MAG: DUF5681 domain-containing protein [Gammaproteobacteria bacterium]
MSNPFKDDDDKVGYGKPPKSGRFVKGKSGNPAGRPKGTPNFKTSLNRALLEPVIVNEGGKRSEITKSDAIAKQMVNKAAAGDLRACDQTIRLMPLVDPSFKGVEHEKTSSADDTRVAQHLIERMQEILKGADDETDDE